MADEGFRIHWHFIWPIKVLEFVYSVFYMANFFSVLGSSFFLSHIVYISNYLPFFHIYLSLKHPLIISSNFYSDIFNVNI